MIDLSTAPATVRLGRPLVRLIDLLLFSIVARVWVTVWLAVYRQARPAVIWALYDEVAAVPPPRRWGRGAAFLGRLPQFAAAQAAAESDPATRTSGDAPAPSTGGGFLGPRGPRRAVAGIVQWGALLFFGLLAVMM